MAVSWKGTKHREGMLAISDTARITDHTNLITVHGSQLEGN